MEKLTKWNAPIGTNNQQIQSAAGLLKAYKPTAVPFGLGTNKKKPSIWRRLSRPWHGPWYNSAKIYLPYILMLSLQIAIILMIPKGHPHAWAAGQCGFTAGLLFMTFLHRMQKKSEDSWRDLDAKFKETMMEIEIEDRVRKEYEENYAP